MNTHEEHINACYAHLMYLGMGITRGQAENAFKAILRDAITGTDITDFYYLRDTAMYYVCFMAGVGVGGSFNIALVVTDYVDKYCRKLPLLKFLRNN